MLEQEAFLTGFGMARESAVGKTAESGFLDDIDDSARDSQGRRPGAESHEHHRVGSQRCFRYPYSKASSFM